MTYQKIEKQINDYKKDNIQKIAQLFPNVVKDGQLDFDALKEEFGEAEEAGKERYEFVWSGKADAKKTAREDIDKKTLKYSEKESKNPETTKNLYIEGDNLEVLKLLRNNYYGSIKLIYIDPPYNTGNDFVYHDRFHAGWLNMIYPRLKLARDFLREDGVIFLSIDDNEQENLKKICDEIFGRDNFVAQIIWERAYAPVNLKKHFSESHDYILCYAKNLPELSCNGLPRNAESDSRYANPDKDERGLWTSGDLSVGPVVPEKVYEITTPGGRKIMPPDGYCWRLSKETFAEYVKDNRIWFGKDGNNVPRIKRFLSEVKQGITPMTIWNCKDVGHSQEATKGLKKLFDGKAYFDYPKPVGLIERCLQLYTDKDSIVLDFFSGSATTAHAVMRLNAEDGGSRRFIMVQLPEKTRKNSIAAKDGYQTICDIGKERIRRAGDAIQKEYPDVLQDIGFKVFRVADTNLKWDNMEDKSGKADRDGAAVSENGQNPPDSPDFTTGASDADIVYELMLRQRNVPLSEALELLSDIGNRTWLYAGAYLVCLEPDISTELVNKLTELNPLPTKFIFRESAVQNGTGLKDEMLRRLENAVTKNGGAGKAADTAELISAPVCILF